MQSIEGASYSDSKSRLASRRAFLHLPPTRNHTNEPALEFNVARPHELWDTFMHQKVNRGQFIEGLIRLTGAAMTAGAFYELDAIENRLTGDGLVLGNAFNLTERTSYFNPIDGARNGLSGQSTENSALLTFASKVYELNSKENLDNPTHVKRYAHRAGNTPNGYRDSYELGLAGVDVDMIEVDGEILVNHGDFRKIFGLVVGYDMDRGRLGTLMVGKPKMTLEEAFIEAARNRVDLILEPKRGNFRDPLLKRIVDLSDEYEVHAKIHSPDRKLISKGREISGKPQDWLDRVKNEDEFRKLIKQNGKRLPGGIMTDNEDFVVKCARELGETFLILGEATQKRIDNTSWLGVVNGYMTDLPVWKSILAIAA